MTATMQAHAGNELENGGNATKTAAPRLSWLNRETANGEREDGRQGQLEIACGTAHGTVVRKQTSDTRIKGHQVRATKDDPQYIVESDNGGKAAHKEGALKKA